MRAVLAIAAVEMSGSLPIALSVPAMSAAVEILRAIK